MNKHLSNFEIDVWFADGKQNGEIATHVASCVRCSTYVRELDSLLLSVEDLPQPSFSVDSTRRTPTSLRSPLRFLAPATAALALAAAMALYIHSRTPVDSPDYVGAKGAPAVQLLVRSSRTTRVWDGRSAVRAGDAIAVRVACEHLKHVAVAAETLSGIARIEEVPCPSEPDTLPFTLVVDNQPGHERFAVVLTKERVDDARLLELVRTNTRDRDAWVMAFDLSKEPR